MARAISVHDLRKLSADAIKALPDAVPIKDGTETVGVLLPVRSASKDDLREVLGRIDSATAQRTPEENAVIDRLLSGRGGD